MELNECQIEPTSESSKRRSFKERIKQSFRITGRSKFSSTGTDTTDETFDSTDTGTDDTTRFIGEGTDTTTTATNAVIRLPRSTCLSFKLCSYRRKKSNRKQQSRGVDSVFSDNVSDCGDDDCPYGAVVEDHPNGKIVNEVVFAADQSCEVVFADESCVLEVINETIEGVIRNEVALRLLLSSVTEEDDGNEEDEKEEEDEEEEDDYVDLGDVAECSKEEIIVDNGRVIDSGENYRINDISVTTTNNEKYNNYNTSKDLNTSSDNNSENDDDVAVDIKKNDRNDRFEEHDYANIDVETTEDINNGNNDYDVDVDIINNNNSNDNNNHGNIIDSTDKRNRANTICKEEETNTPVTTANNIETSSTLGQQCNGRPPITTIHQHNEEEGNPPTMALHVLTDVEDVNTPPPPPSPQPIMSSYNHKTRHFLSRLFSIKKAFGKSKSKLDATNDTIINNDNGNEEVDEVIHRQNGGEGGSYEIRKSKDNTSFVVTFNDPSESQRSSLRLSRGSSAKLSIHHDSFNRGPRPSYIIPLNDHSRSTSASSLQFRTGLMENEMDLSYLIDYANQAFEHHPPYACDVGVSGGLTDASYYEGIDAPETSYIENPNALNSSTSDIAGESGESLLDNLRDSEEYLSGDESDISKSLDDLEHKRDTMRGGGDGGGDGGGGAVRQKSIRTHGGSADNILKKSHNLPQQRMFAHREGVCRSLDMMTSDQRPRIMTSQQRIMTSDDQARESLCESLHLGDMDDEEVIIAEGPDLIL